MGHPHNISAQFLFYFVLNYIIFVFKNVLTLPDIYYVSSRIFLFVITTFHKNY